MLTISSELTTELARTDGARERFLLEAEFLPVEGSAETLRVHNGLGTLTFNGNAFTGVLEALQVSEVVAGTMDNAEGFVVTVPASADMITRARTYDYQGRPVAIYEAYLAEDGSLIGAFQIAAGYMDTMKIEHSGTTATIEVRVDSVFQELSRPKRLLLSPNEQRSRVADDDTMDMLAGLDGAIFPFPKASYFRE